MNKSILKLAAQFFLVLFVVGVLSSCNKRGSGCPDAFKIDSVALPSIVCIK